MWRIIEAVVEQKTTFASVAPGFWYPGTGFYYEGPDCYGLTLHEHLSVYLDWLTGVGYSIKRGLADAEGLQAQLGSWLVWYVWFIGSLLHEIEQQVAEHNAATPGWIELVRLAQDKIVPDPPTGPPQTRGMKSAHGGLPL